MRRPHWKQLESSSLDSVWYNRFTRVLHVLFNSGHYYIYDNVSYYRYLKLIHAESKGRYFYYFIRMKYVYRRVI
jgi:hypothetical protein